ncbi:MAG: hypothetical protein IKX28_07080 [Bacteroidales bacterium]|nr:hypothetical protein [Bacteroidales bacterium]
MKRRVKEGEAISHYQAYQPMDIAIGDANSGPILHRLPPTTATRVANQKGTHQWISFFRSVFLFLFLYFFFFDPDFSFIKWISSAYLLYFFAFLYFLLHSKELIKIASRFQRELLVLLSIFVYSIFRTIIGGEAGYVFVHFRMLLDIFVLPICFVYLCHSWKITSKCAIRWFLVVGSVAAILSCLCFLIPSFNIYVRYTLLAFEEDSYLLTNLNRGFGIASTLTSAYASALSVITCFGLVYSANNKWFFLMVPFMIVAMMVCARTSFVLLIFGVFVYLLAHGNRGSLFIVAALVLLLYIIICIAIEKETEMGVTIAWALDFFNQFFSVFETGSVEGTTAERLLAEDLVWPNGLFNWIFGIGKNILHNDTSQIRSDIGFTRQLFYGGIIYLYLLIQLVVTICKRSRNRVFRGFVFLFLVAFIIFNFKGQFLPDTAGFRVFVLLYFITRYGNLKKVVSNAYR